MNYFIFLTFSFGESYGSASGSVSQKYGSVDPDPYQKCHGSLTLLILYNFFCNPGKDKVIKFIVSHQKCTIEKNPSFSKEEIPLKSLNLNKNLVYSLQKLISRNNSRIRIWIR